MPEPGKREHIHLTLFGKDKFVYVDVQANSPAIMVDELSLFTDMCLVSGREAAGKYFVGRTVGRIATLEQLTQMPANVREIVNDLLKELPDQQTP